MSEQEIALELKRIIAQRLMMAAQLQLLGASQPPVPPEKPPAPKGLWVVWTITGALVCTLILSITVLRITRPDPETQKQQTIATLRKWLDELEQPKTMPRCED